MPLPRRGWHETFRRGCDVCKSLAARVDGDRRRDAKGTHRLYDRHRDCASHHDHGPPLLAARADVGFCSEFRDPLVGLRDGDRVNHAEAAVSICGPRDSRTDGDRRHRD